MTHKEIKAIKVQTILEVASGTLWQASFDEKLGIELQEKMRDLYIEIDKHIDMLGDILTGETT